MLLRLTEAMICTVNAQGPVDFAVPFIYNDISQTGLHNIDSLQG